jgi:hypothetical protein
MTDELRRTTVTITVQDADGNGYTLTAFNCHDVNLSSRTRDLVAAIHPDLRMQPIVSRRDPLDFRLSFEAHSDPDRDPFADLYVMQRLSPPPEQETT